MSINLSTTAIDISNTSDTRIPMLHNLQANILKHHGRDHAWHILLEFLPGKETEIKKWISSELADRNFGIITSAFKQLTDVKLRKASDPEKPFNGGIITCFFLTAKGYQRLGIRPEVIAGRGRSFPSMRDSRNEQLRDPAVGAWESAFRAESHAMLLIADDDKDRLKKLFRKIRLQTKGIIHIISRQKGEMLFKDEKPVEHFGYEDGISQPRFLAGEPENSQSEWKDFAPLNTVLTIDRGTSEEDCYGSFMVFRKLEQNVKLFFSLREKLAQALFGTSNNIEKEKLSGALVVGRFENGIPVTTSDNENIQMDNRNDFDYQRDLKASRCPLHAHIRITNPRFKVNNSFVKTRIVRRGIPYDEIGREPDLSDRPERGVGLFFISYQNDIRKFETIQRWAGGGSVIMHPLRGVDGIAGRGAYRNQQQQWPTKWGVEEAEPLTRDLFMDVVTMLGGEYFFTPSIPFLAKLSG